MTILNKVKDILSDGYSKNHSENILEMECSLPVKQEINRELLAIAGPFLQEDQEDFTEKYYHEILFSHIGKLRIKVNPEKEGYTLKFQDDNKRNHIKD